jgi:hypothetical protein
MPTDSESTQHDGSAPDDRQQNRREINVERELDRGYESWVRRLIVHRGKLALVVGLTSSLFTAAGFRVYGPGHDVAELRSSLVKRDTVAMLRAVHAEESIAALALRTSALEADAAFKNFLLCMILKRTDATAVPQNCGPIISGGPRP